MADRVAIAVRPHRRRLDPDGPAAAVVRVAEFLGTHTRLSLHDPAGLRILAELPEPPPGLAHGQSVRLGWSTADGWLLPAA